MKILKSKDDFKKLFLTYLFEREKEHMGKTAQIGGGTEADGRGETIFPLSRESSTGLLPRTLGP